MKKRNIFIKIIITFTLVMQFLLLQAAEPPASCPCDPDDPLLDDCIQANAELCGVVVPVDSHILVFAAAAFLFGLYSICRKMNYSGMQR